MMIRTKHFCSFILTFFVISTISLAHGFTCKEYLNYRNAISKSPSRIGPVYETHPGPRDSYGVLRIDDRSNRVIIRDLTSEALAPIFDEMMSLRFTRLEEVKDWMIKYEVLINSLVAKPESDNFPTGGSFKLIRDGFDKRFSHSMSFDGFWSWKETQEFKFGLDLKNLDTSRKLVTSIYFLISLFNKNNFELIFEDAFKGAGPLFTNHSYSKLDFSYMMDFAFISYLHSLTLLNARPNDSRYLAMANYEWLTQLLTPQPGEKLSLVEQLALRLRPGVLAAGGLSFAGVTEPLVIQNGKLVFSQSMKQLFKVSGEYWEFKSTTSRNFETGLGCPAGVCPHSPSSKSSIAILSDILLYIYRLVDEVGISGTGLYDERDKSVYIKAGYQKDSLRVYFEDSTTN